mgnify:CR=1 FL=1
MPATKRPDLNILDLIGVSEGQSMSEAIEVSMRAAEAADEQGFSRYWFAEHHNTPNLASNATTLLIDRAASRTSRIRVGSGGIMLPNHAPLQVIEQFGTLVQFHGDRIDLGLGRAPGTDQITAQLLGRTSAEPAEFGRAIADMQAWASGNTTSRYKIGAYVAEGTEVPMWVLGSSLAGAQIAASMGLPFSVASHFAPFSYLQALDLYRREFDATAPTAQIKEPRTMVGVNVVVADTDAEAMRQFSTLQQMFAAISTGQKLGGIQPPREIADVLELHILDHVNRTLAVSAVGSPARVVEQLEAIARDTKADEFIVTGYFFDPEDRFKSQRLLAEAWF